MVVAISEILPTVDYPPMIRGSLRLMLQLKDAFLGCFNLIEEYRSQLLACQKGFARELIVYQLTEGLAGIKNLQEELVNLETHSQGLANRNGFLRNYLLKIYSSDTENDHIQRGVKLRLTNKDICSSRLGATTMRMSGTLPPPISAPDSIEAALHGGLDQFSQKVNVNVVEVPQGIDLATTTTESGARLLPVVEFYRGFYFLQMHFQIIMCQAANYAMPVVTRPMTISERAFSWPSMPSFGLASKTGTMRDRLMEIHTDVVRLAQQLHACLALVRDKLRQDKVIENYYFQHTAAQESVKRTLLRAIQNQRSYVECLESQNDRLAGLAIKLDPHFAKTSEFNVMTGPGTPFYSNEGNDNINQNSTHTQVDITKPADHVENFFKDSKMAEQQLSNPSGYTNLINYNESKHELDADRIISTNGLTSGETCYPTVWIQQTGNTLTSGKINSSCQYKITDVKNSLYKNYGKQAIENLLLGLDSVPNGTNPLLLTFDTPTMQTMDGNAISAFDELSKSIKSPMGHQKQQLTYLSERTASTQGTNADSIRTTASIEVSPITVTSTYSNQVPVSVDEKKLSLMDSYDKENINKPKIENDQYGARSERILQRATFVNDQEKVQRDREHEVDEATDDTFDNLSPKLTHKEHAHSPMGSSSPHSRDHPNFDTNVNASDLILPQIVKDFGKSKKPQRFGKNIKPICSSTTSSIVPCKRLDRNVHSSDERKDLYRTTKCKCDSELCSEQNEESWPMFQSHYHMPSNLRPPHSPGCHYNDQQYHELKEMKLVPTVGTHQCSSMCVPEWINHAPKTENLLNEPKRSAINRALISHRCRLVETILQADEEKLEELINLLLK